MAKKIVRVSDRMQKHYRYQLVAPPGKNFHPDFRPDLSPKQMLALGVFGGVYMRDCKKEFPPSWFRGTKFQKKGVYKPDPKINFFKVNASQPLWVWQKNGWIHPQDPRGWFQWYCRYYQGRRTEDDLRQIKRWRAIARHASQIKKYCKKGDIQCRPRQRQALLHWAYDSRKI